MFKKESFKSFFSNTDTHKTRLILAVGSIGLLMLLLLIVIPTLRQKDDQNKTDKMARESTEVLPILDDIFTRAKNWSNDSIIYSCEGRDFDASFGILNFTCTFYSPSRGQIASVVWNNSQLNLSNPITVLESFGESIEKENPILNPEDLEFNLRDFISQYEDENDFEVDTISIVIDNQGITKLDKVNIAKITLVNENGDRKDLLVDLTQKYLIYD